MSADLNISTHSRQYLRSSVTSRFNRRDAFNNLSDVERSAVKSKLTDQSEQLKALDSKIQNIKWANTENFDGLDEELQQCEGYQDKIFTCLASLSAANPPNPRSPPVSMNPIDAARSLLKSPTAPLPTYSGIESEDLTRFISQFEETISRFNYPSYDKFLLLKQQLSGRARILVDSLEITNQTYAEAVKLLKVALDCPVAKKFSVIKQLTNIDLSSCSDPFEFISKFRKVNEVVKLLNVDCDSFLQYFFWFGLTDTFRQQYVSLTNETRPSLNTLNEKFFQVCERVSFTKSANLKNNYDPVYKDQSATAMASKVDFASNSNEKSKRQFKPCSLCTKSNGREADHPIYSCTTYANPKEKVAKIKQFHGCLKCTNLDHDISKCTFKLYKRCGQCSKWHFSFLCTNPPLSDHVNTKKNKSRSVSANTVTEESDSVQTVTNLLSMCNGGVREARSVIPTFCCKTSMGHKLRGLRDMGCQSNFVKSSVAINNNFKILKESVSIKVTGFNSSRNLSAKIVSVPVYIGHKSYEIPAITVPKINITLKLVGLNDVAHEFARKGYVLADSQLLESDVISDLDFVLGTQSAYCLPCNEISFGASSDSLYAQTDIGVMLLGDIDVMKRNLINLPSVTNETVAVPSIISGTGISNAESDCSVGVFDGERVTDDCFLTTSANFLVMDDDHLNVSELDGANFDILEESCSRSLSLDSHCDSEISSEENKNLMSWAMRCLTRDNDGRICLPLLWNHRVKHLLGLNRGLAEAVLKSNVRKLKSIEGSIGLIDEVFRKQTDSGMIERIENIDEFVDNNPNSSFLSHMAIFKPDRESTKVRVVFLSNLSEKTKSGNVSHNQCIHPGPVLNQKISTSLIQLRFGSYLLTYDLVKAFNQVSLPELDCNKLLFLWYKNPTQGDFSLIGFRSLRLPFGLRCAPTLLMLALYKILVIDAESDSTDLAQLKKSMYQLLYVDNGALCADSEVQLTQMYNKLEPIFSNYCFAVQQLCTNSVELQNNIDSVTSETLSTEVKLLGMLWNRNTDELYSRCISLNIDACTKRDILSSIASQYDVHNLNGPLLNRSRLFLHKLQCEKCIGWDDVLPANLLNEWKNIVNQANSAPILKVARNVGSRKHSFRLIAYTDASSEIYGTVVYIHDLDTNKVSFLLAKNRIVNLKMKSKTIPSLEMQGILLGVRSLVDLYTELAGSACVDPINITELCLYSDSLVSLHWLNSVSKKLDKMNKRSVFIMNRLTEIQNLCEIHPVKFEFVSGTQNPADCITRKLSYNMLVKTNYLTGIVPLEQNSELSLIIPNPNSLPVSTSIQHASVTNEPCAEHLISLSRFEKFDKLVGVYAKVLLFVSNLKCKVRKCNIPSDRNSLHAAKLEIIRTEQKLCFPEVFDYFSSKKTRKIPNIITQLNVFVDEESIIRVKSKFRTPNQQGNIRSFPILLPKHSRLTEMLIEDLHQSMSHSGCYVVLKEFRKLFYVPCHFSVVKRVLRNCVHCKRFNVRPFKLNQSYYRDFRTNPPSIPFSYVFMDYLGYYYTYDGVNKVKVWILCITCMWSRAINLKVCVDQSMNEFLRAFQLHCFQYGVPSYCVTDLGTQLTAGGKVIMDFLNEAEVSKYFEEHGVQSTKFDHYFKGCSKLGGMVEIMVKMVKRLVYGSVKNNVLPLRQFEFLIEQVIHLANRRPVAFQSSLRDSSIDVPEPVSPEKLIHGFDLISVNVIPDLQPRPPDIDFHPDSSSLILDSYDKLRRVRENLIRIYNDEFMSTLIAQAVDRQSRYKPVYRENPAVGDLVLIKEDCCKPQNFPMAIIVKTFTNAQGEVTHAEVKKGRTREISRRHITSLLPLLQHESVCDVPRDVVCDTVECDPVSPARPVRRAALLSRELSKAMLSE